MAWLSQRNSSERLRWSGREVLERGHKAVELAYFEVKLAALMLKKVALDSLATALAWQVNR